jgi:glycogen debranching enzyme
MRLLFLLLISGSLFAQRKVSDLIGSSESIQGRAAYLSTPYVTAGDKLYMVGHQDGTFPPLGWHVKDEMGGIWAHPIKLLDGFEASYTDGGKVVQLDKASSFINYPFANQHVYAGSEIQVQRFQFVPDGKKAVYVEHVFTNKTSVKKTITFSLVTRSNLRPVWIGERTGMVDSKDLQQFKEGKTVLKDSANTWFAVIGSVFSAKTFALPRLPEKPNVAVSQSTYSLEIPANGSISFPFVIAGSAVSEAEALATFTMVLENGSTLALTKKRRFQKIAAQSDIQISDANLTQAMRWLKYNADWLINDVDGIGRGITAGMPDYPWFFGGDMTYSLQGLISSGRKDVAYSTIDLIAQISEKTNGNGRIVHEVSTNGAVYNPGNIGETSQFASLIYKVYCWTGDSAFLNKYFPLVEKGLGWLMLQDKDHNLIPDGNGMMEIHGLDSEMIDVAAYTGKAFLDGSKMAEQIGRADLARQYAVNYEAIRLKINSDFWVPSSNSYADFLGTKSQALALTKDAIERARGLKNDWAVEELQALQKQISANPDTTKRGFVLHHNWVVNTPMETGLADADKAEKALKTAEKFRNKFGMYVTGIDRSASSDKAESYAAKVGKSEFTYTGTVMTLPTGVQAISSSNYGQPNEAYDLVQRMLRTFSFALPGSIYEVSPDYGMMTQAWNSYAFEVPVIQQFFGIQPLAYKKEIYVQPSWPDSLHSGSIKNVEIGDNALSISYVRGAKKSTYILNQKKPWTMYFSPQTATYKRWILDGEIVKPTIRNGRPTLKLKGWRHHLVLIE